MPKKSEAIECPEYDILVKGMEEARARVREAGKAAVGALFKAFFAEYPEVTAIGWTQYTPHFNDGDPCVFSVHTLYATTKTDVDFAGVSRLWDAEETTGFTESYGLTGATKEAVERLERSKDEDLFEAAFGDHVMIVATPDGFHVNEYSHG